MEVVVFFYLLQHGGVIVCGDEGNMKSPPSDMKGKNSYPPILTPRKRVRILTLQG